MGMMSISDTSEMMEMEIRFWQVAKQGCSLKTWYWGMRGAEVVSFNITTQCGLTLGDQQQADAIHCHCEKLLDCKRQQMTVLSLQDEHIQHTI